VSSLGSLVVPTRLLSGLALQHTYLCWSCRSRYLPYQRLGLTRAADQDFGVCQARIPVLLPDNWELIRQNTLSAQSTSTPTLSGPVTGSPMTPRPAGPGGIASRNPFSSPSSGRKLTPQKMTSHPTLPPKHPDHDATELLATPETPPDSASIDVEPVLTISSSGMTLPSNSPTQLTANEIPITPVMVQTQSSNWKINSLGVAPPQQGRGRNKALPSQSEAKDPRPGKKRPGCRTRSCHQYKTTPFLTLPTFSSSIALASGTCNVIEPVQRGGERPQVLPCKTRLARSSRLPLACRSRHGPPVVDWYQLAGS
jgi:hypothetical protein